MSPGCHKYSCFVYVCARTCALFKGSWSFVLHSISSQHKFAVKINILQVIEMAFSIGRPSKSCDETMAFMRHCSQDTAHSADRRIFCCFFLIILDINFLKTRTKYFIKVGISLYSILVVTYLFTTSRSLSLRFYHLYKHHFFN